MIVGDPATYGKGTVQSVLQLAPLMKQFRYSTRYDPGGLVVTIEKFYRPGGASTQLKGVEADLVVPSMSSQAETGEGALANALPWDQIRAAEFEKQNRVQPFLAELRARSERRIAQKREFAYLREDISRYKELMDRNTISLNEAERRKERGATEARLATRKKEREAQRDPNEKVFEITLRNAAQPGLPPPMGRTNAMAAAPRPAFEDSGAPNYFQTDRNGGLDLTLEEAQRILLDYVSVQKAN